MDSRVTALSGNPSEPGYLAWVNEAVCATSTTPAARPITWQTICLLVGAVALVAAAYRWIDVRQIHDAMERLPGWSVFVVLVALPLLGCPVSVLHVAAGMRWGPVWGVVLVALSILLQLLASYGLVHLFRPLFARRLESVRRRIPHGAHAPVTLFTLLLPGVPYFLKNYTLPLIGIPLRTYLLWAFPLHVVRASVAVIFGHESDQLTPWRIAGFCAYAVLISLSCGWAFRRLRAQVSVPPPAVGDPTPHA